MGNPSNSLVKGLAIGIIIQILKFVWKENGMHLMYPNVSIYSIKDCVLGDKELCQSVKDDFSRLYFDTSGIQNDDFLEMS